MKLRTMRPEDLDQVSQLYQAANQFATVTNIHKWTLEGLEQFPQLNFVIEEQENILGAISAVLKNKGCAEINDIAVRKDFQNKQLGSRLMKRIFQGFNEYKIEKVSLWVHWTNSRAIPFYYRWGFKIKDVSQTQNILGVPDGEDIIHLEKEL